MSNYVVLREGMPTRRQIAFWDPVVGRASEFLDPLTSGRLEKSVIAIWERRLA
jgi:hypothetical protein